ncbi:MAG: DUF2782 domain-containing protein [Pseudomonadota bacterium]
MSPAAPSNRSRRALSAILRLRVWSVVVALGLIAASGLTHAEDVLRSLEGPDVTIIAGEDRTVYEYRQNGNLRMVKIVPTIGRPYYLVPADDTRGFGDLEQARMLIPKWVIVEF